jgi:glycosyltransferase involved in cell wall biosynthesis
VKQKPRRQSRPRLSLVVPTRNEHENVVPLVNRVSAALSGVEYELIFVDDSDDKTPLVIRQAMAASPCIRLLHREPEQREGGLASAVTAGIRRARGTFISVMDGDLQHPPELLPQLLAAGEDADVVVASRYMAGGDSGGLDGITRQLVSRGSKLAAQMLFARVRKCTDPMSGFFLFRREVVAGVDLRPIGFKILLEILVRGYWSRLTEVPYSFVAREVGASKADVRQGVAYLRHLRDLRLRGDRGYGAVRYRAPRPAAGPDDPQPLDDDLPEDPEIAGKRRRRLLWTIGLMALALRLILLPIGHWWDLTVDYNVFIDLIHNRSPYDTMAYLTHIARAAGWDVSYEYYAYPPVPLYLYLPLAKIYGLLHPSAHYFIPVSGSFAMPSLTLDFFLLLKLPIWIADFLLAALLARMSGTIRGWRDYLLNPYVLLVSGAWTFDAIMVLGLVLGVYYLQRGRFVSSGLALAFGTMVKFLPALVVPTIVIYMIKKQRPVREIAAFVGAFAIGFVVLLGPFWQGLLYVLSFHSGRVGGGMNWLMFWRLGDFFPKNLPLDPMSYALSAFGMPILVIALLLAYWYCFIRAEMRLNRMILVTFAAFMVGSKLVNEQYALVMLPFAYLEMRHVGGAWRWFYRLLWIVPLAFAIVRVPIDRFLWLFYHTFMGTSADVIAVSGQTGLEWPIFPWFNQFEDQVLILVLGMAFFVLCLVVLAWPVRPARRLWRYHLPPVAVPARWVAPEAPAVAAASASASASERDTVPPREVALRL